MHHDMFENIKRLEREVEDVHEKDREKQRKIMPYRSVVHHDYFTLGLLRL
jgi:hypothetical protein